MCSDKRVQIQFDIDTTRATSSIRGLKAEYRDWLKEMGKSPSEIRTFMQLAADAEKGAAEVDNLDDETRQLLETYQALSKVARARETLSLIPHAKITEEIQQVRSAYADLKQSGKLTHAELAQAALKMEQQVVSLRSQTNGWVDALGDVKLALGTVAAGGAGLTVAVRQALDFEAAMADVRKVTDLTDEGFADLTDRIKGMSAEVPIGIDALAGMAAAAGQLGIAGEDIDKFVMLAAKMATAFDMSAEQAGESIAKLKNVFQLPIEGVESLGDAINTLGNNTAARESDIVQALARIGGTARQFGLAADEAAALSAALIALGKPPEVAATAINALLTKLQTANVGTKDFKAALGELGLSADQLARDISARPQEALTGFLGTLRQLDNQARAETLARLFGSEYQDDIALLVGSLGDYEKALGLVSDRQAVAGAMSDEFRQRMSTAGAQIELLKNAVNVLAVNLGTVFLPVVAQVAQGLADGTTAIAEFVQQFPAISGLAATLIPLVAGLSGLRVAFRAMGVVATQAAAGAGAAVRLLTAEVTAATLATSKLTTAFNVLGAAVVGWEIGSWARREFSVVERMGIALAGGLHTAFERIRYGWDAFKAAFTDDTLVEATARHLQRAEEIRDGYSRLFQASINREQEAAEAAQKAAQDAAAAAKALAEAATLVEIPMVAAAASVAGVSEEYRTLRREGESAGAALAKVFDKLDLREATGIKRAVAAVVELAAEADSAGEVFQRRLVDVLGGLSGQELVAFRAALQDAFDEGRLGAEQFGAAMDAVANASLSSVGLSLSQLRTGLSDAERDAVKMFEAFTSSGQRSADEVARFIEAIKGQIKSPEALNALQGVVTAWEKTSTGAVDRVRASMADLSKDVAGAADQVFAVLAQRIESAGTAEALAAITKEILDLSTQGKIAAEIVGPALVEVRRRGEELKASNPAETMTQVAEASKAAQAELEGAGDAMTEFAERSAAAAAELEVFKQRGRDIAEGLASTINNTTQSMWALGDNVGRAFEQLQFGTSGARTEVERLRAELERARGEASDFGSAALQSGFTFGGYLNELAAAAANVRARFYQQRLEVVELAKAFDEGRIPVGALSYDMEDLQRRFDLLDDSDLSGLLSQINRVQSQIDSLNGSLTNTITALRQELASLQGDTIAVEDLRYQEQKLELEERYQQAKKTGDQESIRLAEEALRLQQQAYELRRRAAQEAEAEARARAAEQRQRDAEAAQERERREREQQDRQAARDRIDDTRTQSTKTTTQTTQTHRIELVTSTGRQARLDVPADQVAGFLDVLSEAGLRTR